METKEQVRVEEIEKEFEPVIGYKSIKNEMIKICDIMRNSKFYSKLGVSVPNGLLISGGSDYHGSNKPHISMGSGRGNLRIPESVLHTLEAQLHFH